MISAILQIQIDLNLLILDYAVLLNRIKLDNCFEYFTLYSNNKRIQNVPKAIFNISSVFITGVTLYDKDRHISY